MPGFDVSAWHGWFAPAALLPATVRSLNASLASAVKSPDVASKLAEDDGDPLGGSPEQLHKLIAREVPRWRKVAYGGGMQVD